MMTNKDVLFLGGITLIALVIPTIMMLVGLNPEHSIYLLWVFMISIIASKYNKKTNKWLESEFNWFKKITDEDDK